ncbi:hypothetical protein [Paraburkholderia ginsengiterrae]|uniref:Uncharacterized protein n=1 Tax=Paraburkholderia ginsengiterrae TaxID=1462993 RepID=A0A1A9MXT2_9BURK|nr:hypothetical protein [Paraburkholderia ginsengiterrae]OAJ52674.1 hypothetical protein A6V37_09570 [Paraburkholderia ginsengiterrae]
MSAPESSNSKVPPSLLSDKAKGTDGNGSRILANLEGRVAPPTEKPRRSKAPLALIALLVIAAGGWGAWHLQQRGQSESLASATSASVEKPAMAAAAASAVPQVAAKAEAPAPASSQAATIVADDSDSKAASGSVSGDESRLSRALADGAEPSSAPAPVASATSASAVTVPAAKHGKAATAVAARDKHGKKESATASSHHASAPTAVAQAKKTRPSGTAAKDDSDADLLAALVARTKPAETKTASGNVATKVSASTTGDAKLAERVKECGQRGFFEDQLCRWRVCDGHWGKDPACPGSATPARPQ